MTAQPVAPERPELVGRTAAIETMLAAVARGRTDGGTVIVLGEIGFGKTVMLDDLSSRLGGWTALRIQADRVESTVRYSTIDTLIRALNLRIGERLLAPEPDAETATIGRIILDAIDRLPSPVALLIDDAHWVDTASARAIRFVVRRLAGRPFLIVAASRPRGTRGSSLVDELITASSRHEIVTLEPLSVGNAQELAHHILGHSVSRRTASRLTDATHGSPLLLAALLEQMRETFADALHPAGWDTPLATNARLATAVSAALEGAAPEVRRAAEFVAVLRDPVPAPMFGSIAAKLNAEVDAASAVQLGIVRAVERDGVTWFEPAHGMIADALSAELPLLKRVKIHRAAASILSGRRALRHRVEAAKRTDPGLVEELLTASRECADLAENDEAMSYARAAVTLSPAGPAHDRALLEIGLLAMRTRSHERIFDLLRDLEALPPSLVRDIIVAELRILTGNVPGAFALTSTILSDPDDSPEARAIKAHAACDIPMIQMATRQFAPVIEQVALAREILAAAPASSAEIADPALKWIVQPREDGLRLLGWLMTAAAHLERHDLTEDAVLEVDQLAKSAPGSPALVDVFVTRARLFILSGDLLRARSDLERANELMLAFPASWTSSHGRTMFSHVLFLLGEWDESVALADNAVALALDETDLSGWPLALTASTLVRAGRGDERVVEERLATANRMKSGIIAGSYDSDLPYLALAELARARHRPADQLAAAQEARRVASESSTMGWLSYEIDALATLGHAEQARIALAECERPSTRWQPYYGSLAWLTGRVAEAEGDLPGALAAYRRACEGDDAELCPLPFAVALVDYARVLSQTGHAVDANLTLRRAVDVFGRLGAVDYLARASAEMDQVESSAPAASHDSDAQPFDQLTARERQVAQALAAGMTNKEIAERLYVSVTTVNFHVRNILAKLGLTSRRELRRMPSSPRARSMPPQRHDDRPQDHRPVKS